MEKSMSLIVLWEIMILSGLMSLKVMSSKGKNTDVEYVDYEYHWVRDRVVSTSLSEFSTEFNHRVCDYTMFVDG